METTTSGRVQATRDAWRGFLALSVALTAAVLLLRGGSLSAQTPPSLPSPTVIAGLTNVGTVYYVDNDLGNDAFDCLAPAVNLPLLTATPSPTPTPTPASGIIDGPCKTIQHAIGLTRDRDLVIVASQEPIPLNAAIEVPDLIGIVAANQVPAQCQDLTGQTRCLRDPCQDVAGGSKTVLQSGYGGPVFHVTAVGMASLHALIAGFILGGTTSFSDPGAITLDHDAFTELRCNIIGQEDLPNVIGILTNSSEHAWIHDNTVHGASQFPISATLGPTPPVGGLGLVTGECLGSSSRSDQLLVEGNLFAFNSNAGIWICSDGSGGHILRGNNVRSNGRGIVLLSAVDTVLRQNEIGDNYYDGVDILEASANDTLEGNQIESQEGPSSTGVLLQGDGVLFPLGIALTDNEIRRNRVDVLVAGARGTRLSGNSISALGERTGVLFAIGNDSGLGDADFGQPASTVFRGNKLYDDGVCEPVRGCAIRLLPGVTSDIDATGNDFGVTDPAAVQAVIWDEGRDPELGQVLFAGTPAASGSVATAGRRATRARGVVVTVTPFPLLPATTVPLPAATPATPMPDPTLTPSPSSTASPALTPPAATGTAQPIPAGSAGGSIAPLAYIDPASGNYYVELALCVSDATGRPVGGDALALAFFDGAGNALGLARATADHQGCFSGDVQAPGPGAAVQPARLNISDASGASIDLAVDLGSPLTRPPTGPLQSE
jgi:parallel beta-helix repeat protein